MIPSLSFRLSTYLTLAIACAGLGYAETAMLPEVGVFAIVVILALGVIYRLEPRMQLLSLNEANRFGAGIAVFALLWAGFRVIREYKTAEFETYGWPVFIVALLAPLLMAAICGKLLRREKHAGDYWFMHGAALAAMVLAGALAEQAALAALTACYAFFAIGSLGSFFHERTAGHIPIIPSRAGGESTLPIRYVATERSGLGLFRVAVWFGLAFGAALPIYLLTPRSGYGKFEMDRSRIEIGYAADQMIDLTQTGDLRANPETAFEVDALDHAGKPKTDLNESEHRWRGTVLASYTNGSWKRDVSLPFPTSPSTGPRSMPWPPDFGSAGYRLSFTVPTKLKALFLSDPVAFLPGGPVPVADLNRLGEPAGAWLPFANGLIFGRTWTPTGDQSRYVQYTREPAEADLSPPYALANVALASLSTNTIPSVKAYADQVLADSVAAGRLRAEVGQRDSIRFLPEPRHHEAIARVFRDHLFQRSDLVYTTELRRENRTVDPVEDFLFHSKMGHCERFSTALVLMLRAEGIPAVMVLGFKGCEHMGNGHYVVRQEHAHAWAEALISRPAADPKRPRQWHWLSLDASPVQEAQTSAADSANSLFSRTRTTLEQLVFHYSPEQRDRAVEALWELMTSAEFLAGVGIVALCIFAITAVRRNRAKRAAVIPPGEPHWFDQLLAVLARQGFNPSPGQTAREFVDFVAAALPPQHGSVLHEWVDSYYEDRFGGTTIAEGRLAKLEDDLHVLKQALAGATHL